MLEGRPDVASPRLSASAASSSLLSPGRASVALEDDALIAGAVDVDAPAARDVANSYSARVRREDQWGALRSLRKISSLARVRRCHHSPTGDLVTIARRGARAHYSGLQKCGSVWACPVCSARIQAERTDELVAAVEEAHRQGLTVAMVTLTMRHDRRCKLAPMWDALSSAFASAMTTDRAVQKAKQAAGVVGWVRRVEATHGRNGWHLHVHALLFIDGNAPLEGLELSMWAGWVRSLQRHGLDADVHHGIDLRRLDLEQSRQEVGRYLTKSTYERASVARELAGQHGKSGRRGNRTPFDVLADLTRYGLAGDLAIWREWEQASRGRRAMGWSKGIRDRLRVGQERDDETIAADNDGDQLDLVMLTVDAWRVIAARRLETVLLAIAESVPPDRVFDEIASYMAAEDIGGVIRPPERE